METTENETNTETQITLKHAMLATEFKPTEAARFIELIDEEVIKEVCDVSTKKGRDRERSLAAGISSFKVHMNKLALLSIEEQMATVKSTKGYLKDFNAECDERRDKRKAATIEAEAKEQARKDGHRAAIIELDVELDVEEDISVEELESKMSALEKFDFDSLEEFKEEGARVAAASISKIAHRINAEKEKAAQAAELARLQQKEAAREHISRISDWATGLALLHIDQLRECAEGVKISCIDYDFGDLQAEADLARGNAMMQIEAAIKAEENRLQLEEENQKLKDAARKIKDDAQAVIDAAKLAEEQKEDDIWDAAHTEDGLRQDVKDAVAKALEEDRKKKAEASRLEDLAEAKETERLRLASEDKKHRADVINQSIRAIHDGANESISISLDQAAVVVDLIAAGFVPDIEIKF